MISELSSTCTFTTSLCRIIHQIRKEPKFHIKADVCKHKWSTPMQPTLPAPVLCSVNTIYRMLENSLKWFNFHTLRYYLPKSRCCLLQFGLRWSDLRPDTRAKSWPHLSHRGLMRFSCRSRCSCLLISCSSRLSPPEYELQGSLSTECWQ